MELGKIPPHDIDAEQAVLGRTIELKGEMLYSSDTYQQVPAEALVSRSALALE